LDERLEGNRKYRHRAGLQVLGAIGLYIIGRWLISFAVGLVQKDPKW
jgi:hypothetical protein